MGLRLTLESLAAKVNERQMSGDLLELVSGRNWVGAVLAPKGGSNI